MKIGILGYGSIGRRHAANARTLGHEVIVYDPMLQDNDVKFEREVYDLADAVVIATPSDCHEAGLRACIERGKHVLVEKPISTSLGQLPALLDRAYEKDLVVMMGNNLRFHASTKRAKQLIDSHALGQIRWANFICATEYTATAARDGVILNTGSHEVDLALFLFGSADVLTATSDRDISADFVLQHHQGNVRSTFHIDIDTPARVRQFWISGTENSYQFDLDVRTSYSHSDKGTYLGGSYDNDYIEEMRTFIDRVEGNSSASGADGYSGLDVLHVLLDVRKMAGLM